MSLEQASNKVSRKTEMGPGTYLATITEIKYLRHPATKDLIRPNGFDVMVVTFRNEEKSIHEEHYDIDGSFRQENLKKMMAAAQVKAAEGQKPTVNDAKGCKLWICVKAVHFINDDVPVIENGIPVIEHRIFKVVPFVSGGKRPSVSGDPVMNGGIASGPFMDYKNFAVQTEKKSALITHEPCPPDAEPQF